MFKMIQTTDDMERISRKYFCDNMDEVLDTVEKENKAYVLTEEGKNDLVLCPAKWMLPVDSQYGLMMICAIRYALSRRSYLPNEVIGYIEETIDFLSDSNLKNNTARYRRSNRK